MSEKRNQVSRRQFLNYTLTGVGGFMAAGMLAPMVRFAIDPVLKTSAQSDMVAVADLSEISDEPTRIDWTIDQVDGWYESEVPKSAWVYKDENDDIIALSPVCKHLGCFVNWQGDESHPDQFYCPCHDGRYYKSGVNVPNTPPEEPLDEFEVRIDGQTLYLGQTKPHREA
ncbi:ubiquinol-cytochrome c reductase iron-sulfur subunit [Aquibacillus sediminis]|uniref:QcrA and Rieske domain-containing protein n=1 Tax=Aquibacillus sediminis TaxID=2574734 RepID=UPI00110842B2|nr:ubiquinol-cytochrome c reductase iron-sulfur subunit [Aquibacillus sediminis]